MREVNGASPSGMPVVGEDFPALRISQSVEVRKEVHPPRCRPVAAFGDASVGPHGEGDGGAGQLYRFRDPEGKGVFGAYLVTRRAPDGDHGRGDAGDRQL